MTDSDEDEPMFVYDITRPRRFSRGLVASMAVACVGELFASVGELFENVAMTLVSHEKWVDENAAIGKAIESLTDVTPFQ